jgi:Zn-dependent oligopeptidase
VIKNSLIHPIDELHYDRYSPADAAAAIEQTEKLAWDKINQVLNSKEARSFENTVLGLTRASLEFDAVINIVGHMESVLGEPWREADVMASARASQFSSDFFLHSGIYAAVKSIQEQHDTRFSQPQKKLLDDLISNFERGGVNLPEEQKNRLKELNKELSEASTLFGQNATKAHDAAGVNVLDKNELGGLGEEFIAEAGLKAKQKNLKGYWLSYSEPNLLRVMSECSVRKTRRAMFEAARSMGLEPNIPLSKKIISLRYEKAKLLGYQNFADFALEKRMAQTGRRARNFIAELIKAYVNEVPKETAELQEFARKL